MHKRREDRENRNLAELERVGEWGELDAGLKLINGEHTETGD